MKFEIFDRALQKEILLLAVESYPDMVGRPRFNNSRLAQEDNRKLVVNLAYLMEHGLIDSDTKTSTGEQVIRNYSFKATHHGVDFMLADGGITAILNLVTIKIHNDSILQIAEFIKASSASPADKKKLLDRLKSLGDDSTKHIVLKLLDAGLARTPDVIQWLKTVLPEG
ncbi:Uncharacterised protein [Yersinia intermedia]|uniref:hypothetical protein n=1 Tax=Yersinia intermedia TaxID=631 RepID=UPI0005E066F7|nr:hypothetical protein [Yersinia intermedia]CNH17709.1 Uncharacterised protein [Yersinia intermedia]CQJ57545.1 Uncharacterised protein [Yersinia intermedia]